LDVNNPVTYGPIDLQDYYFEHKRQHALAMDNALKAIPQVFAEFENLSGRRYDFLEPYKMDDAEIAVVVLSSTCGTTRTVVNALRERGIKAGLLKLHVFRPFPAEQIAGALAKVKAVAVLDRAESLSTRGGPVFNEVCSALYSQLSLRPELRARATLNSQPLVVNYIYGLGGRDINTQQIESVYADLSKIVKQNKIENLINYIGVRE